MGGSEGMIMDKSPDISLKDHLVIFAWDQKIVKILDFVLERERRCGRVASNLIITDSGNGIPWDEIKGEGIYRMMGDPTDDKFLRNADVEKGRNIIILADNRSRELADARSILIVLALKSISKELHVCVEVVDPDNIASLRMARADHIISIPNLREKLLAQAAVTHYVSHIYREIFNLRREQSIFSLSFGDEFKGKKVEEISRDLYGRGMIMIGLWDHKLERVHINPPRQSLLRDDDRIVVLAAQGSVERSRECDWHIEADALHIPPQ
jgi:Trk K+ transport system NAD-binding subunit